MSGAEFKEAVKARGWKYAEASEALGKSVGMIKQYAAGNKPIPPMVALLLAGVPQAIKLLHADKERVTTAGEPDEAPGSELLSALSQITVLKDQNQKLREKLNTCCPQAKPGGMRDIKHGPPKSSL
tara:strand:- start:272 stop:649 length:378 start_codon:yes stop_codon:yes gene_type:complete